MNKLRKTIHGFNSVINFSVIVFLVTFLIVGLYVLWDTSYVHTEANSKRWKQYKPSKENPYTYDQLLKINPDVCAWIEIYGTEIDYPVMYSSNDEYFYYNHDPFKKNSAIGSIFMDYKCSKDFSDFKTILYGHHMEASCMFGDVGLFKKEDFFNSHLYGNLHIGDTDYGIRIFGFIETVTQNGVVYDTHVSRSEGRNHYNRLLEYKKFWRDNCFDFDKDKMLLLSTCANGAGADRIILVTGITDETYENPFGEKLNFGLGVEDLKGWLGFPWVAWFAALVVVVLIIVSILWQVDRLKKKNLIENGVRYDLFK